MTLEWTEETLCRAARQMTQGLAAALPEEDVPSLPRRNGCGG